MINQLCSPDREWISLPITMFQKTYFTNGRTMIIFPSSHFSDSNIYAHSKRMPYGEKETRTMFLALSPHKKPVYYAVISAKMVKALPHKNAFIRFEGKNCQWHFDIKYLWYITKFIGDIEIDIRAKNTYQSCAVSALQFRSLKNPAIFGLIMPIIEPLLGVDAKIIDLVPDGKNLVLPSLKTELKKEIKARYSDFPNIIVA